MTGSGRVTGQKSWPSSITKWLKGILQFRFGSDSATTKVTKITTAIRLQIRLRQWKWMSSQSLIEGMYSTAQMTFFFRDVDCKKKINNFWTNQDNYGHWLVANCRCSYTATLVACKAAGNTLYRQSVPSIEQLAVTLTYLATGKTSCALE